MTSRPVLVAVTGDQHVNWKLGLCPPKARNEGTGGVLSTRVQAAVWRRWREFWRIVGQRKADLGATLYAIVNGDALDINKHDGVELMSRARPDAKQSGVDAFAPMLDVADGVFWIRGTEAHEGPGNEMMEFLADDCAITIPDDAPADGGRKSWYWLWAEFGGVTFDVQHHPKTGSRRYHTRAAAAAREQWEIRTAYIERGDKVPDVAIRSHRHYFADSGATYKPRVWCLPPWCLSGAFGSRLGYGADVEPIGGLLFTCQDGEYETEVLRWAVKGRRKPWTISE